MRVIKITGSNESIKEEDVGKIVFTDSNMIIEGPERTIPIDSIWKIVFKDTVHEAVKFTKKDIMSLSKVYPNPFNPIIVIDFNIERAGKLNVSIYNCLGKKVKTLVDEHKSAGDYKVVWDEDKSIAAGTYILKIVLDNEMISSNKLVFLK
jgi:hypothetical protein